MERKNQMNKKKQLRQQLKLPIYPTETSKEINNIVEDLNNELRSIEITKKLKVNNPNVKEKEISSTSYLNKPSKIVKTNPKPNKIFSKSNLSNKKKAQSKKDNDFKLFDDAVESRGEHNFNWQSTESIPKHNFKSKSDTNLMLLANYRINSKKFQTIRSHGKTKNNHIYNVRSQIDLSNVDKKNEEEICFPNLIEPSPLFGKNYARIILKIYKNKFNVDAVKYNIKKLAPLFKIVPPYSKHFSRFLSYKQRVEHAIQKHKVFIMYGDYKGVRDALVERGWVEISTDIKNLLRQSFYGLLKNARNGNKYESALFTKMLKDTPANFVWQTRDMEDMYAISKPFRNMVRCKEELDFTSKEGLLNCVNNSHWYTINGISEVQTPRTYNLSDSDGRSEFRRNYRTTYCISLLYYIIYKSDKFIKFYNSDKCQLDKLKSDDEQKYCTNWLCTKSEFNSIPIHALKYAFDRIENEIQYKQHDDIDVLLTLDKPSNEAEWYKFKLAANLIQLQNKKIYSKNIEKFGIFLHKCEEYLYKAGEIWPVHIDGYRNIWIVKPSKLRRGEGILVTTNFDEIMDLALKDPNIPYIVQKYIERPLLIHNTKFDIRQYMLLTVRNHILTIWMYKESYMRFSSQEFKLDNLHESVHLTNYIIQRKYKNGKRSPNLPYENMWYLYQFNNYLNSINQHGIYEKKIYPKMKKHLIAIVLASLEQTTFNDKTFEIFGCDFMLDTYFNPYLIEVNHTPGMSYFTAVMNKCCSQTLKDLVKVVVDYSTNTKSDTGLFEQIYRISLNEKRFTNKVNTLKINGDKLKIYKTFKEDLELDTCFMKKEV